jgi:predicted Rossmann-fold nucleotide-binding protein
VTTWSKLGIHAKPCGVLNVCGYFDPLGAMLDATVREGFMAAEYREILIFDPSPATLLDRL